MSRPANPSFVTITYATDVSYAAGALPWQGAPTKVAPAGMTTGVTPKSGFAAQSFNYLINYCAGSIATLKATDGAILDFVGQVPVLNFFKGVLSGSFNASAWNPTQQTWYAGGLSAVLSYSVDGIAWTPITLTSAAGETLSSIAQDPSGNMLVASLTRYAFDVPRVGANVKRDVFAAALTLTSSKALYDGIHSKWAVVGFVSGTAGIVVRNSLDRATWTAGATNAATWTTSTTRFDADVSPFTGRIVGIGLVGANAVPATSDDDGATWTARTSFTPTSGGSFTFSSLTADPANSGAWFYAIGGSGTGLCASSIYKSTDDGVTWTLLKAFVNTHVKKVVRFGSMLVGYGNMRASSVDTSSGGAASTVFSLDEGVTWLKSNQFIDPLNAGSDIAVGDGQLMVTGFGAMYASTRVGRSTTAAT